MLRILIGAVVGGAALGAGAALAVAAGVGVDSACASKRSIAGTCCAPVGAGVGLTATCSSPQAVLISSTMRGSTCTVGGAASTGASVRKKSAHRADVARAARACIA